MTTTTFINGTVIEPTWLNDVNTATYTITGTGNAVRATAPTITSPTISSGNVTVSTGNVYVSAGKVGIGTSSPAVSLAISGTDAALIPSGTTAQRPTGATGYIRFNSSTTLFEGYNGTAWDPFSGTVTSVAASVPAFLSISGSPITTTGTLAITYSGTPLPVANGGTGLTSISTLQTPIGSFLWHTASSVPTNYLEANGAAISRSTYAALFAVIGTTYGVGNGSTTFNVPDVRGYFVRGYDNGRGVDSGRAFGSNQLATHVGTIQDSRTTQQLSAQTEGDAITTSAETFYVMSGYNNTTNTSTGGVFVGARPINIAFLPCIRYQ
jgi:microcystin-dependent protein